MKPNPNPELDLVLERVVDIQPDLIWQAWTEPALLKKWFCPKPWVVAECEMDVRPGGIFMTVMQGPNGESFSGTGCILEVVPGRKLVWTTALQSDYRPNVRNKDGNEMHFTCVVQIEPHENGTHYRAMACHPDRESREQHEKMGFLEGWGAAFDQLIELTKEM